MRSAILIGMVCVLFSSPALAGANACDSLQGEKKALANKLMDSVHSYACCDETISACLKKKEPCDVAKRLANRICARAAKGDSAEKIKRRIERRAASMNPAAKRAKMDLSGTPVVGSSSAPVNLVVYACARCPFCSRLVPRLYDKVTTGPLKGKVQLYFKPFPLKNHEGSKEGGLAMVAAHRMGKFWPHMLRIYKNFDQFQRDKLAQWAALDGMDPQAFTKLMNDPKTRDELVDSKKEGLANGVDATPQLFINGRKYTGYLDMDELVDVLEEEAARLK